MMIEHIQAATHHARRGALKNAFSYGVDFILTDFSASRPWLFSHNCFNLWSLHDARHGGPRDEGRGVDWFRDVLAQRGFPLEGAKLLLLTQPDMLWFRFNPVSFWIATIDGVPRAFVAEVNSTFGQRHCYFCALEGFAPIERTDRITAEKLMHVSPFQTVEGQYHFNLDMTGDAIRMRIAYENGSQGVIATLAGQRRPATNASLLWAALRRPFGGGRVLALIHWQALVLWVKRAPFLKKQPAPEAPLSDSANVNVRVAGE